MMSMLILVSVVVILQAFMTYWETKPFLRELIKIKLTSRNEWQRISRTIKALPMLWPALFDGVITLIGTFMGLTGSTYGAAAVLIGGLVTSCIIKIHRHFVAPKWTEQISIDLEHI